MKPNDIYRWRYTDEYLKKVNHGNNGGTTYWCCSQIAICKETEGGLKLYDTYWSHEPRIIDPIEKNVALEYLGNLNDYKKLEKYYLKYYKKEDVLDITNPNSFGLEIYVKKDAKRDFETVKAHIQREIKEKEYKAKSAADDVIRYKKVLDELTEDNLDQVWI